VQPDALLRWHRELFRLYWKRKSKTSAHQPKIPAETIALIRRMATDNRLWGAERIRGELLKLGLRVLSVPVNLGADVRGVFTQ
jgi:putative transposase